MDGLLLGSSGERDGEAVNQNPLCVLGAVLMTSPRGRMFWTARGCDAGLLPPDDDGFAVVPPLLPLLGFAADGVPEDVGFGALPLGAGLACA